MTPDTHTSGALILSPAVGVLVLLFVLPIAVFLWRAVSNEDMTVSIPNTADALRHWNRTDLPGNEVASAFASDARNLAKDQIQLGRFVRRANYHQPGARTAIMKTVRILSSDPTDPVDMERLGSIDPLWSNHGWWAVLAQQSASRVTPTFLLAAIDMKIGEEGELVSAQPKKVLYRTVLFRTVAISLSVTAVVLLLAYPAAYTLASAQGRLATGLMLVLMVSFWISLLIKTLSWIVLFQREGILNQILISTGVVSEPLTMLYTRIAVVVAMAHMMLPFMILPIYSVMKRIPPNLVRASQSLGAGSVHTFLRVYLPMSLPGVTGGCMLVSVLALGFYITPQLLGGPQDQMTSYYVAFFTNKDVNWPLASALGVWLLLVAFAFSCGLLLINRFAQPQNRFVR